MGESGTKIDWTRGAAKWAAVGVLGAVGVGGLGWSMTREGRSWRPAERVQTVIVMPRESGRAPGAATERGSALFDPNHARELAPKPSSPSAPTVTRKININTASKAELELLPGIGPALAQRILDQREQRGMYKRVEDLDAVKGIGPKLLERLREQVCVE